MKNRNRNVNLNFWVTPEEKKIIEKKTEIARKKSMSEYIREAAICERVLVYDYDELALRDMTKEINKIGVNINQVAARANSTDNVYQEDLDYLKTEVEKIWQLQKSILSKLR